MSQPPKRKDPDSFEEEEPTRVTSVRRRQITSEQWPPRELSLTTEHETEGLCGSVPESGTLPYVPERAKSRRVIRLVSIVSEIDMSIELQEGVNRIGRQRDGNHIVLVDPEVSRFHAEIDVGADSILLRDLQSANGTFVNDQQVSGSQQLRAGDVIAFSNHFAFMLLVDIAMEQPQVEMLARSGEDPLPSTESLPSDALGSDEIPSSLKERSNRHPSDGFEVYQLSQQRPETSEEVLLERERRQLAVLYQVSKRCMGARSLKELDSLLINVLERIVSFDRGFLAYQLPRGDWKLLRTPKGDRWSRKEIRKLLAISIKADGNPVLISDSRKDDKLGTPGRGQSDARLLLPMVAHAAHIGTIFLITRRAYALDDATVEFMSLFADIAALAIDNCTRIC